MKWLKANWGIFLVIAAIGFWFYKKKHPAAVPAAKNPNPNLQALVDGTNSNLNDVSQALQTSLQPLPDIGAFLSDPMNNLLGY